MFSLLKIQSAKNSSGFVIQFIIMVTHWNNFAKSVTTVVLLTLKIKQNKTNLHPLALLICFNLRMKEPDMSTMGSNSVK